ncbi:MAG: hypothetical protein ACE5Z5_12585 [Candidatus Bathyarchaeia archaeon]
MRWGERRVGRLRLNAHYRLYRQNPEGYRDLTMSVFIRLEPFKDLYAKVEFLQGSEVVIDLLLRAPTAEEKGSAEEGFIPIHKGLQLRIMGLDKDAALIDAITRVKGDNPHVKRSLERLQEALIEELITG